MQYTVAFSVWDVLHYERLSGCFTSLNLDRLELYSNHISQNNSHSRMETGEGGGRDGGAGSYSAVNCQGCARDLHALCASGARTSFLPLLVKTAGTREDFHTEEESSRGVASPVLRSRQTFS